MPDNLSVQVYAKINLSLDITGKRPDGYHTISTIMQNVDLFDTVTVQRIDKPQDEHITVTCNDSETPEDKSNTAYKAACEFFEYTSIKDKGVTIKIKKNIPVAAGLGGGSADAAGVLYSMNKLFHSNLSDDELCEIGENIGMDVPFFIDGGTQLAEGLGTILTPLPSIIDSAFLIIKNGKKASTAKMYQQADSLEEPIHPPISEIAEYICEGEREDAAELFANSFEPLWGDEYFKIKQALIDCGAIAACLTGSGPSVFGLFEDEDDARRAKSMLDSTYDEIYVCSPVSFGIEEK